MKSKNCRMKLKLRIYQVIMTEKDYFKIKDFKINNIGYLKVTLEIKLKQKLYENNKII